MKETAGTLLYRKSENSPEQSQQLPSYEILLVHASGNYNKQSAWSIPKGLPDAGETLEQAARRETIEETGVIAEELTELGYIDYTKSKKRVHAFYGKAPDNAAPYNASWEVDQACFHTIERAKTIIHPDQAELILRLESILAS